MSYLDLAPDSWERKLLDLALSGIEEQVAQQRNLLVAKPNNAECYSWHGLLIHDQANGQVYVEIEDAVRVVDHVGLPITYQRLVRSVQAARSEWECSECLTFNIPF